ncbi:hypothetical protein Y032_0010g1097 [Ancylostoma ceylanicum]|nr:hypothetical protein Y032_0010g1097 [Ancylostoma ceylanicum]
MLTEAPITIITRRGSQIKNPRPLPWKRRRAAGAVRALFLPSSTNFYSQTCSVPPLAYQLPLIHFRDEAYISRPSGVVAQSCLRFGEDLTSPTGLVWPAEARWKPWPSYRSGEMRGMRSRADAART